MVVGRAVPSLLLRTLCLREAWRFRRPTPNSLPPSGGAHANARELPRALTRFAVRELRNAKREMIAPGGVQSLRRPSGANNTKQIRGRRCAQARPGAKVVLRAHNFAPSIGALLRRLANCTPTKPRNELGKSRRTGETSASGSATGLRAAIHKRPAAPARLVRRARSSAAEIAACEQAASSLAFKIGLLARPHNKWLASLCVQARGLEAKRLHFCLVWCAPPPPLRKLPEARVARTPSGRASALWSCNSSGAGATSHEPGGDKSC